MRWICLLLCVAAWPSAAQVPVWVSATGRVLDARTGHPVVGAAVSRLWCADDGDPSSCEAMPGDYASLTYTDVQGRFTVHSTLPTTYAVRIESAGYQTVTLPPYNERELMDAHRAEQAALEQRRHRRNIPHYALRLVPTDGAPEP